MKRKCKIIHNIITNKLRYLLYTNFISIRQVQINSILIIELIYTVYNVYTYMLKNNHDLIVKLFSGIPELKIPTLEPFVIDELDLKVFQGLSALLGGNIQKSNKTRAFARNLTIHHSSEFILHDLK